MTTISKISKRAVMIRAWKIYRRGNYSKNFGECLSRAWWVEKETQKALLEEYYWEHPEARPETLGDRIRRENREKGIPEPVFTRDLRGKFSFI
ncbi:hypothetical protein M2480_001326 [Parabacteroides sp. PFB2-12]|uniref:hypothetical protein n=1 Tax=unclassified Parabacteroides TaxID=2649774 RepID=UPI0024734A93|nr:MULTISPECIES: hypothetical protein [unclassified Parabacteroides]MDH6343337.1 hypothetical protein [Parabacteroides sp. PM6-13]MDH6390353.1 hypothetical protein [Parabacteroides sp. PFB2-12]